MVGLMKKGLTWKKAAQVTSCLWVSEVCDSESNSPSAGHISTWDFDIKAASSQEDFWPKRHGKQSRKTVNWGYSLGGKETNLKSWNARTHRLPTVASELQELDCFKEAGGCRVSFLVGCACTCSVCRGCFFLGGVWGWFAWSEYLHLQSEIDQIKL